MRGFLHLLAPVEPKALLTRVLIGALEDHCTGAGCAQPQAAVKPSVGRLYRFPGLGCGARMTSRPACCQHGHHHHDGVKGHTTMMQEE